MNNKDKLNRLILDINNNIDLLVDAFSKDTGISANDVYVEVSVECYDESLDE